MVFSATLNNISVILCGSVLLVEETRGPRENHNVNIILVLYRKYFNHFHLNFLFSSVLRMLKWTWQLNLDSNIFYCQIYTIRLNTSLPTNIKFSVVSYKHRSDIEYDVYKQL